MYRERGKISANESYPSVPSYAKSISPGANFYGFINGNWIRNATMPPYSSSYGVSEEIEDAIKPSLENIINNAKKEIVSTAEKSLDENTVLLGNLMNSAINRGSQDLNIKFVRNLVLNLRCIRSPDDVARAIGEFVKYRVATVFTVFTGPEEKHSNNLRLIIGTGNLGLPDTSYYTVLTPGRVKVLDVYNTLIGNLGDDFDIPDLNLYVGIEKILADAIEQCRGDEEILMKGSELRKKYPSIPWSGFIDATFNWPPSKFNDFTFLISSDRWLRFVNKWFRTWSLENWKSLLAGNLLLHCLPLLPSPYDTIHFEFFGNRLRGQNEKVPRYILGLELTKHWLSGPLGEEYVKCCVDPSLKRYATSLAKEILDAASHRLSSNEWLEPKTREKAVKKLKDVYLGIAYPSSFPANPKVSLNPETFVKNIFALGTAEFEKDVKRANTQLDPTHWEDAVFEVNAYYYNEGNRLILPAGILNSPFFDIEKGDGWNFGGIGAIIGHELTHAFDMDGKNYDEHGNRASWWTMKDNRNYNKKTRAMIALYNRTKYFNANINGTLTLSENIADLGGVAIALTALKLRLDKKRVSKEEYRTQLCNFFESYAVSWRTKEKKKKALQSIFTDVHAPPIARVNNIVRQFDDWYECFDVKPGQLLYTSPEDRIRIF